MVGLGLSYDAMITGDFIPSRDNQNPVRDVDTSSRF
jgi:hypothetical protein